MQFLLAAVAVAFAFTMVAYPIMHGVDESAVDSEREELEIAKQAKYREIRDTELDLRAGKLTQEQWEQTDRELRKEAMAILARMDSGSGAAPPEATAPTQ